MVPMTYDGLSAAMMASHPDAAVENDFITLTDESSATKIQLRRTKSCPTLDTLVGQRTNADELQEVYVVPQRSMNGVVNVGVSPTSAGVSVVSQAPDPFDTTSSGDMRSKVKESHNAEQVHAAPLSLKTFVLKEGARTLVMHLKGLLAFLSHQIRAVGISDEEAESLMLKVVKERVNLDDGHNLLVLIPGRANEICQSLQGSERHFLEEVIHFFEQHGYRVLSLSHFGKKQTWKQLEGNFRSFQEAKRCILNRISNGGTGLGLESLELQGNETHIWARP